MTTSAILLGCLASIATFALGLSLGLSQRVFKALFPPEPGDRTTPPAPVQQAAVVFTRDRVRILEGRWVSRLERRHGYAVLATRRDDEYWLDLRAVQLAQMALGAQHVIDPGLRRN